LIRGRGTKAESFSISSLGDKTMAQVPSRHARRSARRTSPLGKETTMW